MSGWIERIVETYGTAAVFAGTALEGEAAAIAGGVLAHRELLDLWPVMLAASAGAYLSDVVIYGLALKYRDAPRLRAVIEHDSIANLVRRMSTNMVLFALLFRFIPGMRTAGPVSLAALGMAPLVYGALTGVAAVVWGTSGVLMGFFMGHTIEMIFGELHRIEHALIGPAIVAACLGGGVWLWRRRRQRQPARSDAND